MYDTQRPMVQKLQHMIDDREDRRWAMKARRGDRRAFDRLVLKHQKRVYFTVMKLLHDPEAAHDVVQDVFVKAYVKLSQFDLSRPFYPWLHRIAINTALNALNRQQRMGSTSWPDADFVDSEEASPEQAVMTGELEAAVAKAIAALPEGQREVFVLRTAEGLKYEEIAEALGLTAGTVMSRLSRARARMKLLLAPYLIETLTKD